MADTTATTKADMRDVLVVHTILRRLLDKLIAAAERLDPADAARVIPPRWALYARGLHHHHEGEDHDFFPVIVRANADTESLVTQLEHEHQELVRLLDATDTAMRELEQQPIVEHQQSAHDAMVAVHDQLFSHLDKEEAQLLPVAADAVDPKEWKRLGDEAFRSIPKSDLPIVSGAFEAVVKSLPPADRPAPPPLFVRVLVAISWRKRYQQFVAPLDAAAASA
jgi:hemerythrin-like domain-containing protein